MWEVRVESLPVKESASKLDYEASEVTLNVTLGMIRDGTNGISLALGGDVVGEWTDSMGCSLTLADECRVGVRGPGGDVRYVVVLPGVPVSGEQLSDNQVAVKVLV